MITEKFDKYLQDTLPISGYEHQFTTEEKLLNKFDYSKRLVDFTDQQIVEFMKKHNIRKASDLLYELSTVAKNQNIIARIYGLADYKTFLEKKSELEERLKKLCGK